MIVNWRMCMSVSYLDKYFCCKIKQRKGHLYTVGRLCLLVEHWNRTIACPLPCPPAHLLMWWLSELNTRYEVPGPTTTSHRPPHPEPMLEQARQIQNGHQADLLGCRRGRDGEFCGQTQGGSEEEQPAENWAKEVYFPAEHKNMIFP